MIGCALRLLDFSVLMRTNGRYLHLQRHFKLYNSIHSSLLYRLNTLQEVQ